MPSEQVFAIVIGILLGTCVSGYILSLYFDRRNRLMQLRWTRRAADAEAERDLHRDKLARGHDQAIQNEASIRRALAESEETVAVLSDDKLPAFERELEGRNQRIRELERDLARRRAQNADARDQLQLLGRQLDDQATELEARDERIDELLGRTAEIADLKQIVARQETGLASVQQRLAARESELADSEQQLEALRHDLAVFDEAFGEAQSVATQRESANLAAARELHVLRDQSKRQREDAEGRLSTLRTELAAREQRIHRLVNDTADLHARLADRDRQLVSTTDELDVLRQQAPVLRTQLTENERKQQELQSTLMQRDESMSQIRAELAAVRETRAGMRENLLARDHTIVDLQRRVREYEAQLPDYELELHRRDERVADLDREFSALEQRLPTLNDALREREASIEDLVEALGRERRRNAVLRHEMSKSTQAQSGTGRHNNVIRLRQHLQHEGPATAGSGTHHGRIASLNALDAQPGWCLEEPRGKKDDLKRIRGIGPVIERTLNALGIFHFDQLAALGQRDVEWVAAHIDTFPDRIERDRWIEQARELRTQDTSGSHRSGA